MGFLRVCSGVRMQTPCSLHDLFLDACSPVSRTGGLLPFMSSRTEDWRGLTDRGDESDSYTNLCPNPGTRCESLVGRSSCSLVFA